MILCRSVAQVMLQESPLTGVLFLIGILAGSLGYGGSGHMAVFVYALGSLVLIIPISGDLRRSDNYVRGLNGFNAVLVGCAASTFFSVDLPTWLCIMAVWLTLPLKKVCDMAFARIGSSSLTLPFILATWILIYVARWRGVAMYVPESIVEIPDVTFISVVEGWMKGLSQIFLIDSWVTGVLFVAGLLVAGYKTALWALAGSATGMIMAALCGCEWTGIAQGLWGFSPALTAIAVGVTFRPVYATKRWYIVTLTAIICTFVIQWLITPVFTLISMPVLTLPFCIVTWLISVYVGRQSQH